ncbi:MAG: PIG-L family deacetylase [Chloroflexi bacterium]|nr:PIG-L family deacetylase [Chloroflexota bacterium]
MAGNEQSQLHVIISPHFDDGVFSCGGTASKLAAAGHSVLVITMMGGLYQGALPDTPILADLHRRWRAGEDPLRQRQIEDERASRALGVDFMHVPLPDCVYRLAGDLALYPSEESLFADVHPADYAPRLLRGIQIPELETARRVYLPLGVGHHVDHQIVRDWGLTQMRDIPDKSVLRFYVEFPYSKADRSTEMALATMDLKLEAADSVLSEAEMQAKIRAIACYDSQISTFWDSLAAMEADVKRAFYDSQTGAYVERLWKIAA